MRTTLDIEEDILLAAKDIAAREDTSVGRVLSRLARTALTAQSMNEPIKNGIRVFRPKECAPIATLDFVNRLRDED